MMLIMLQDNKCGGLVESVVEFCYAIPQRHLVHAIIMCYQIYILHRNSDGNIPISPSPHVKYKVA